MEFRPTERQSTFLASPADEALYGGAAGGGKSLALLTAPLRWIENGNFRGLYLRRESKYLGDAIDKSQRLYPAFGAKLVQHPRVIWTFPSGATIWFSHCEHESDVANYDSFEFNIVLFDELTHFTEKQYTGIQARLRTTDPTLPTIARAGSNPGGAGHKWVLSRWGAWLDRKHPRPAEAARLRWYLSDKEVSRDTPNAMSRTFIPAKLEDNPHVAAGYESKLFALSSSLRRKQLLGGDWLAADDAKGALWKRAMLESTRVTHAPDLTRIVVAIDPAVTSNEGSAETGIIVAGVGVDGHGYVLDDASDRFTPDGWARRAIMLYDGRFADRVVGEINNGGEMVEHTLRTIEPRVSYKSVHASRGKAIRAEPVAALYEQGKVHHVGPFTDLEDQLCTWEPEPGNKSPDRLDALVWAITELMVRDGAPRTFRESTYEM